MKGPDSPPHRRILRAVVLGALAIATLATAAPAAFADVPTSGALYQDGPSGRFLVAGTWFRRADPRDTGRRRGWQKAGSLGGWQQTTVPNAANAGDNSARSYLGGAGGGMSRPERRRTGSGGGGDGLRRRSRS